MPKTFTLKIKLKFTFYWYSFKIKFQSLFNEELAEDTFWWFMQDLEENNSKYIKVISSRQPNAKAFYFAFLLLAGVKEKAVLD